MADRQRPLVMTADDDPEIRHILSAVLKPLDCDVIQAVDGEEALEKVITDEPDLVVLDVMMPTLSGWEICKYIRSKPQYADTKVLMLTAIGKTVNEMTSPLYGADAYHDKPFDIEEVRGTIQRLLDELKGG